MFPKYLHPASALLFCLAVLIWALTSAAAHFVPSCALITLAFVWFAFAQWHQKHDENELKKLDRPGAVTAFNAAFLVLIAVSAFSIIPLPIDLVRFLSPNAAQYYVDNANLVHQTPTLASFSASRAHTAYALCLLLGQFALFNAVAVSLYRREAMKFSIWLLIAAASIIIFLELANTLEPALLSLGALGSDSLIHVGPPINENHASAILASIAVLALASDLLKRHGDSVPTQKILRLSAWFLASVTVFTLQSRSAIAAWLIAHVLLIAILLSRALKTRSKSIIFSLILLASLGAAFAFVSSSQINDTIDAFENTNFSFSDTYTNRQRTIEKTDLYKDFVPLLNDWSPAGYGRSAFVDVYPAYQSFPFRKRFTHAENEPFEIILEFGPIVALAFFILIALGTVNILKTNARFHTDRSSVSILLALLVLVIQNFFDFSLRYWATGFLAVTYLGILAGRVDYLNANSPSQSTPTKSTPTLLKIFSVSAVALTSLSLIIAAVYINSARDGLMNTQIKTIHSALEKGVSLDNHSKLSFNDAAINIDAIKSYLDEHAASPALLDRMAQALIISAQNSHSKNIYYKEAQNWLLTALKRDPKNVQLALRLSKTALALNHYDISAKFLSDAINNDYKFALVASSELTQYPDEVLKLLTITSNNTHRLLQMSHTFLAAKMYLQSFIMADHAQSLSDNGMANRIRFNTWMSMEFDEPAAQLTADIKSVDNINDFAVMIAWLVHINHIDDLVSLLRSTETILSDSEEYWRLRTIYTAYYAPINDKTKSDFNHALFTLNHLALNSSPCRYDAAIAEAQFALRSNELTHAKTAAQRALKYKSNSKSAKSILIKIEAELNK